MQPLASVLILAAVLQRATEGRDVLPEVSIKSYFLDGFKDLQCRRYIHAAAAFTWHRLVYAYLFCSDYLADARVQTTSVAPAQLKKRHAIDCRTCNHTMADPHKLHSQLLIPCISTSQQPG